MSVSVARTARPALVTPWAGDRLEILVDSRNAGRRTMTRKCIRRKGDSRKAGADDGDPEPHLYTVRRTAFKADKPVPGETSRSRMQASPIRTNLAPVGTSRSKHSAAGGAERRERQQQKARAGVSRYQ
jgi:hypothetical protein